MKICVVTQNLTEAGSSLPPCDIAILSSHLLGEVSYENEIAGKTAKFDSLAHLSRRQGCAYVAGCRTVGGGLVRYSAAVADGGKLLGVADCCHIFDSQTYKSGAGLGLYPLHGIKTGICLEGDFYYPECVQSLCLCGAQLLVGIWERQSDTMVPLLMRAYAYLYGVPFVAVAGKTAYFADITGGMAASPLPVTLFETVPRNEYRVVTTRRKGLSAPTCEDY
jgi:predicted amidohydrolase